MDDFVIMKETGPSPKAIIAARKAAKLTQTEAAALVHTTLRTWQRYEAGDRHMHPAFWELFRIKSATAVTPAANRRSGKDGRR